MIELAHLRDLSYAKVIAAGKYAHANYAGKTNKGKQAEWEKDANSFISGDYEKGAPTPKELKLQTTIVPVDNFADVQKSYEAQVAANQASINRRVAELSGEHSYKYTDSGSSVTLTRVSTNTSTGKKEVLAYKKSTAKDEGVDTTSMGTVKAVLVKQSVEEGNNEDFPRIIVLMSDAYAMIFTNDAGDKVITKTAGGYTLADGVLTFKEDNSIIANKGWNLDSIQKVINKAKDFTLIIQKAKKKYEAAESFLKKTGITIAGPGILGLEKAGFDLKAKFKVLELSSSTLKVQDESLLKTNAKDPVITFIRKSGAGSNLVGSWGLSTIEDGEVTDYMKTIEFVETKSDQSVCTGSDSDASPVSMGVIDCSKPIQYTYNVVSTKGKKSGGSYEYANGYMKLSPSSIVDQLKAKISSLTADDVANAAITALDKLTKELKKGQKKLNRIEEYEIELKTKRAKAAMATLLSAVNSCKDQASAIDGISLDKDITIKSIESILSDDVKTYLLELSKETVEEMKSYLLSYLNHTKDTMECLKDKSPYDDAVAKMKVFKEKMIAEKNRIQTITEKVKKKITELMYKNSFKGSAELLGFHYKVDARQTKGTTISETIDFLKVELDEFFKNEYQIKVKNNMQTLKDKVQRFKNGIKSREGFKEFVKFAKDSVVKTKKAIKKIGEYLEKIKEKLNIAKERVQKAEQYLSDLDKDDFKNLLSSLETKSKDILNETVEKLECIVKLSEILKDNVLTCVSPTVSEYVKTQSKEGAEKIKEYLVAKFKAIKEGYTKLKDFSPKKAAEQDLQKLKDTLSAKIKQIKDTIARVEMKMKEHKNDATEIYNLFKEVMASESLSSSETQ